MTFDGLDDYELENSPLAGAADLEYESRIEAERCTAEFKTRSTRRLDAGRRPITDSPLFGGPAQGELF